MLPAARPSRGGAEYGGYLRCTLSRAEPGLLRTGLPTRHTPLDDGGELLLPRLPRASRPSSLSYPHGCPYQHRGHHRCAPLSLLGLPARCLDLPLSGPSRRSFCKCQPSLHPPFDLSGARHRPCRRLRPRPHDGGALAPASPWRTLCPALRSPLRPDLPYDPWGRESSYRQCRAGLLQRPSVPQSRSRQSALQPFLFAGEGRGL